MLDYKKKYLKYKNKYYEERKKLEGGSLAELLTAIAIETSGGNIFAMSAAKTYEYLRSISQSQLQSFYGDVKVFLETKLLPRVIEQLGLEDVNRESIRRLVQRVESILGNIDGEFTQLVTSIANKISDLDTKIVLKKNTGVQVRYPGLVAFGLTRIKYAGGELLDLSIPVQNTTLGNIVCSSACKEDRLMRELEVIIFNQQADPKTIKRIDRYIFMSIFINVGNIPNADLSIPWYDIRTKLNRQRNNFGSIRSTTLADKQWVDSLIVASSDPAQEQVRRDNVELSEIYEQNNGSQETVIDLPDDPVGRVPLLCDDQQVVNKVRSLRGALGLLHSERGRIFGSINFESILREASRRGVYVQIFNPDVHTVNYFSQRGLNSNDASLVVQALTSKKTEIALKTELHACILARVNKNGSELPYVTLERNISIIVANMNEILQEEIRHLTTMASVAQIENCFSDISQIHEISTVCATVLEKMSYSNLLTAWNDTIVDYYNTHSGELDATNPLTKSTRFVSLKCDQSAEAVVQWDIRALRTDWRGTSWENGHVFSSNHIYALNRCAGLVRLSNTDRYSLLSGISVNLDDLAAHYVRLSAHEKAYYLKLVGTKDVNRLSIFITGLPLDEVKLIYGNQDFMNMFGPTFTEQMRLYISEQERRLYTQPVPQYTQPVPQYTQPVPQYTQPVPQYTQPVPPAGIFSGYDSKPSAYESVAAPLPSLFDSVVSRLNPEQRYYAAPVQPVPVQSSYAQPAHMPSDARVLGNCPTCKKPVYRHEPLRKYAHRYYHEGCR